MYLFGFTLNKEDTELILGQEPLHFRSLGIEFIDSVYRSSLLEGTAVAITDYDACKYKVHAYKEAKLNAMGMAWH
jgi:hypothetical protein